MRHGQCCAIQELFLQLSGDSQDLELRRLKKDRLHMKSTLSYLEKQSNI
jgi:N-dimethylarginine dimethylaminohydrolase